MSHRSFRGGVHPNAAKLTAGLAIEVAPLPAKVVIPLQQHIGAPCKALVKEGDEVLTGQKIGEPGGHVSAPVHASLSGKVSAIAPIANALGQEVPAVVIESDGRDLVDPTLRSHRDWEQMGPEQLVELIREAGLVGMGGAAFPTHVKFSPPKDKPVDTVILNGAECEPYLTCDHRVMLERADRVILGLRAFMRTVNAPNGYVLIEDNKPDAVASMTRAAGYFPNIKVVSVPAKYPQGEERMIIKVLLGREVPRGGLPADVGVVLSNISTAAAFADYLSTGRPLIERVITLTGPGIANPKNLQVRVGMLFEDAVRLAGGLAANATKLIVGGPMTGPAYYNLNLPIVKGTSGLLVFTDKEVKQRPPMACVTCGKCVEACPYGLQPYLLGKYSEMGMVPEAEKIGLMDCRECGSCTYICPSRRPLLQAIKVAKAEVASRRKRA